MSSAKNHLVRLLGKKHVSIIAGKEASVVLPAYSSGGDGHGVRYTEEFHLELFRKIGDMSRLPVGDGFWHDGKRPVHDINFVVKFTATPREFKKIVVLIANHYLDEKCFYVKYGNIPPFLYYR
jgi:hypothetical protein